MQQSNLDVESNHNLSQARILPLDHQDLFELKQFRAMKKEFRAITKNIKKTRLTSRMHFFK